MCAKCKFRFRIRCGPQSGAERGPVSNRHNHHLGSMLERGGKAKFLEWGKSGSGEFFWKRAQNLEARWCFREKHTKMRIQAFNKPTTKKNEKKNRHTTASKKLLSKNAGRRGAQAELRSSPPSALARFAGSGLRPSAGFRWVGPAALGTRRRYRWALNSAIYTFSCESVILNVAVLVSIGSFPLNKESFE